MEKRCRETRQVLDPYIISDKKIIDFRDKIMANNFAKAASNVHCTSSETTPI